MNRRDFMKAGAIGATAGPYLAKQAIVDTAINGFPTTLGMVNSVGGYDNQPFNPKVNELYDQINAVKKVVNCNGATDYMEIDLLTMKSTSLAWKVSVTRKREEARRTIIEELHEQVRKLAGV